MSDKNDGPIPPGTDVSDIQSFIDAHHELIRSLTRFSAEEAFAGIAGLLTDPEWQASTLRLEVLQHFIAIAASGKRKPTKSDFHNWLTEIGSGLVGLMEDPAEDVFVSRVLIPGEDCLIFEGISESAAFQVQRFVNMLDEMPNQGTYLRIKRAAHALLRLSNEVVRRSNLQAFSTGGEAPIRKVSAALLNNPVRLGRRVQFTPDDLTKLNVDLDDLAIFVFNPERRRELVNQHIGHSGLERSPLVVFGDVVYFALPTAASMAIRRMIIEAFLGDGMEPILYAGYKREIASVLAGLPLLGGSIKTPFSFEKANGIYVSNVARYVDEGRVLHVCVIIDDLTTYAASGMSKPDPDPSRLTETIQSSLREAQKQYSKQKEFREGISLIVLCPWGRPIALDVERPADSRWRLQTISAADLETLSWESSFSPLTLWRLQDGKDRLRAMNVHIINVNGILNLYGWAESLDGHLVPHGEVSDDYDPSYALGIAISPNALLAVRKRLSLAWNVHHSLTWDGRNVKVRREAISSFFEEDRFSPMYVSMDDLLEGALSAVYETPSRNWWTAVETPSSKSRKFHYQLWRLTVTWIRRAAPVLEEVLPDLPRRPMRWLTHFYDSEVIQPDAPIPSRDESRAFFKFEVIEDIVHVYAKEGFTLACRNTTNVGESLLVEYLVRGFFSLVKLVPSDQRIAAVLAMIIPDEWARDMHPVPARDYRDFFRSEIPAKPVLISRSDDAFCRLGLGWIPRMREEGAVIEGIEQCCAYLGKIVDCLWDQIRSDLRQYAKRPLLEKLIENHESVMSEGDSWMRSARAMLSLHVDKQQTAMVSARRLARFNGAALSARLLIEMVLCECPNTGGIQAGRLDVARLLVRALLMHQYGGQSEAIRYEGKKAGIQITPLGDVFTLTDFDEKIATPYGEALGVMRFRRGAESYEGNFRVDEPVRSAQETFEPEFWQAWEENFGFTIDDGRKFVDNLDGWGLKQRKFVFGADLAQLVAINRAGGLSLDKIEAILSALAFKPRETWASTPDGFNKRDWYPWRFRRRLSILARPILQLSEGENLLFLIAPSLIRTGFVKLLDYCYRGGFEAKEFPHGMMRAWIGATENRRGHKFNEEVAEKLRTLGWDARTGVKLTEILNDKTEKDFGDVDVLAWSEREVLVIECKDLELAMTAGEIARQLYEFRGKNDNKGRPDRLKRHLIRVNLLRRRSTDVLRFTGTGDNAEIKSVLVFSDIVPMHFAEVANTHSVQLHTFSDLEAL